MLCIAQRKGNINTMATNTSTTAKKQLLDSMVNRRIALKAQLVELTETLADMDSAIIRTMLAEGIKKVETEEGKVNLIQSETIVWNDEVLKELLKPVQWKRIVVEKVDKSRLEAELLVGRIDADEVSVAKSVKQSKPFLR